jgi:hypothetical protein
MANYHTFGFFPGREMFGCTIHSIPISTKTLVAYGLYGFARAKPKSVIEKSKSVIVGLKSVIVGLKSVI